MWVCANRKLSSSSALLRYNAAAAFVHNHHFIELELQPFLHFLALLDTQGTQGSPNSSTQCFVCPRTRFCTICTTRFLRSSEWDNHIIIIITTAYYYWSGFPYFVIISATTQLKETIFQLLQGQFGCFWCPWRARGLCNTSHHSEHRSVA